MLKAVIFDLNGIFFISEKLSDRFKRDFGVPAEEFLPALSEIMAETRKPGAQSSFTYWKPYLEKWGVNLDEKGLYDYWFGAEKPSEEMKQIAKDLKAKGIKVFLLSNNFKERAEYYGHYPWMSEVVDKAYYSWQTGFVKPDPQAWLSLLQENNLQPEECIYFDDQEKNVKAAEDLGIKAHLFKDPSTVKELVGL